MYLLVSLSLPLFLELQKFSFLFTMELTSISTLSSSSVGHGFQDPNARLANELIPRPFTTGAGLYNVLTHRRRVLERNEPGEQFLAFTSVPPKMNRPSSDYRFESHKSTRFFYNTQQRLLIVKLSPGQAHEFATRAFDFSVNSKLLSMGIDFDVVVPCGSTTVTIGNWTMEANSSWEPASRDVKISFVFDVGLSESDSHLFLVTRGWLETPNTTAKLAVTLSIDRQRPKIVFRKWELEPRRAMPTRAYSPSAFVSAELTLSLYNNQTVVTGNSYIANTTTPISQLELPFEKIVGRAPDRLRENDLVITEEDLKRIAEGIWRDQGF
ncbi:unnamed protein product [Penicillium salamii]|nr:unnamed protein product [Penicillium salamii]